MKVLRTLTSPGRALLLPPSLAFASHSLLPRRLLGFRTFTTTTTTTTEVSENDDIEPPAVFPTPTPAPAASSYLPSPPPAFTPSTSAKLAALHARLSLHPSYPVETLCIALTDRSAHPDQNFNNASLSMLGSALLRYFTHEHTMITYPRLPVEILSAVVDAHVGNAALAALGREWGIEAAHAPRADVDAGLLKFKRMAPGDVPRPGGVRIGARIGVSAEYAMATAVRAIFAGVYLHEGLPALRQFVKMHVLTRKLDVDRMMDFVQPTRELSRLCAREGFEPPVARILTETGRFSRNAVFVVGVYSGPELLGEGHGGSLDEARIRAAVNALKGWYMYSPVVKDLPSVTLVDPEAKFRPAFVDVGDVVV